MRVESTGLPGIILFEMAVFTDHRGAFFESWSQARYEQAGLTEQFVQDNVSRSKRGVLRGLHFQHPDAQGKLVSVLSGEILDVVVDIRRGSPTFGKSLSFELSAENARQLYVAPGFAHGFQALTADVLVQYKCTQYYNSHAERSVLWCDESLGIHWPLAPLLSAKDEAASRLRDMEQDALPLYMPS